MPELDRKATRVFAGCDLLLGPHDGGDEGVGDDVGLKASQPTKISF